MKKMVEKLLIPALLLLLNGLVHAASTIDALKVEPNGDGKFEVRITLSGDMPEIGTFSVERPASIAVDFPLTKLNTADSQLKINSGVIKSVRAIEAAGRSRVVIKMTTLTPYTINREGGEVVVRLGDNQEPGVAQITAGKQEQAATEQEGILGADSAPRMAHIVSDINFRRGESGEAKIEIKLGDPTSSVELHQRGDKIQLELFDTPLAQGLQQRLDVIDFATPASTIDAVNSGGGSRITISAVNENYDFMGYQIGETFLVEMIPLSKEELLEKKKAEVGFIGEKLSLNFQNIEVRAVLQLLADFTGLNVVVSDTVAGNVTLRLKNVPWDQALDIILSSRGLGMRQTGNVLMIAPSSEIAARERQNLESQQQLVDLAPLYTKFIQINYARAGDLANLLRSNDTSILSERGRVTVDERTNTLLVLETSDKLDEINTLIKELDIPVQQVMIDARIVVASDDFSKGLGIQTGVTKAGILGGHRISASGSADAAQTVMLSNTLFNDNRMNVSLPVASAGSLGLAVLGSDYLVDLELTAMQSEGKGELVSNPRIITSNQRAATITQGVQIPYQQEAAGGGTTTAFQDAVLSLSVTPQITPDDSVIMQLDISKDNISSVATSGGVPGIDTRTINTEVLVGNGDTVVLGGVFENQKAEGETKVPLLGDIPYLGALFRTRTNTDSKRELLIFVTPKIIDETVNPTL
ncbi:MAG: type IV pilus secretin PilQ [Gammaproteobacteria bacterium]|nr:type IV pilus secretin PilQ [Gammaproteobacteria bacterium]